MTTLYHSLSSRINLNTICNSLAYRYTLFTLLSRLLGYEEFYKYIGLDYNYDLFILGSTEI
jgi:hypothetical protein